MSAVLVPEKDHLILYNIRWETFLALLEDLGEHHGRIAYDRGTLEITSPSDTHESLKRLIGRLIEEFTATLDIKVRSTASTTFKRRIKRRGVEPDESYYVQNEEAVRGKEIDLDSAPPPDLVVEIDITSWSINRRSIYAALGVPEVWTHDGKTLTVRRLSKEGEYVISQKSGVFPRLPLAEVARFLDQRFSVDETSLIRAFRAWVKERFKSD